MYRLYRSIMANETIYMKAHLSEWHLPVTVFISKVSHTCNEVEALLLKLSPNNAFHKGF